SKDKFYVFDVYQGRCWFSAGRGARAERRGCGRVERRRQRLLHEETGLLRVAERVLRGCSAMLLGGPGVLRRGESVLHGRRERDGEGGHERVLRDRCGVLLRRRRML